MESNALKLFCVSVTLNSECLKPKFTWPVFSPVTDQVSDDVCHSWMLATPPGRCWLHFFTREPDFRTWKLQKSTSFQLQSWCLLPLPEAVNRRLKVQFCVLHDK